MNPGARDTISEAQLQAAEDDLRASWRLPPPWIRAAPFAIGALVSFTLALDGGDSTAEQREKRNELLLHGLAGNGILAVMAYLPTPFEAYQQGLAAANLHVGIAPTASGAALSLSGTY